MIGKVCRFLSIKCNDQVQPWVELELGDPNRITNGFLEFLFGERLAAGTTGGLFSTTS